jgi:hypothetical protein
MHILPTAIDEFLCHTGTRSFVRSSTVRDHRSIVWDLVEMLIDFLGGNAYRARQLLLSLSPRRRISRINKRELLPAVHPLSNFINRNSCRFHNVLFIAR